MTDTENEHVMSIRLPKVLVENMKQLAELHSRSLRGEIESALTGYCDLHTYSVYLKENEKEVLQGTYLADSAEQVIVGQVHEHGSAPYIVRRIGTD